MLETLGDLPDSFRSGVGQSYDDKGESCACGIDRMNRKFQGSHLVPALLPKLDEIVEKLPVGAKNIHLRKPIDHPLPEDGSLDLITTLDVCRGGLYSFSHRTL